jgi:cell division protein FtsL
MAKRRVRLRGRSIVALVLIGFLVVAIGVVWRRTVGVANAREIDRLSQRRLHLEGEKGKLEREIREAASRSRLAPIAERRLDMHVATDTQLVILPRTP